MVSAHLWMREFIAMLNRWAEWSWCWGRCSYSWSRMGHWYAFSDNTETCQRNIL